MAKQEGHWAQALTAPLMFMAVAGGTAYMATHGQPSVAIVFGALAFIFGSIILA